MSCSPASHAVPRWRRSAASPLSNFRPQVSPGSKSLSRKPLPLVMRNGWTYFCIPSRISFLGMPQPPVVQAQSTPPGSWTQISTTQFAPAPYSVVDLARCMFPQAQRKPDLKNTVEDRVDADDVKQGQRACSGLGHQNQSEDDREHAARDQQPLVVELLAQPDRPNDLQDPARDRPAGDEQEQDERSDARPGKCQYSDGNAQESHEREPPARRRSTAHDGLRERQHAVSEREGAVEKYQREQRYSRPDEGEHPEQDGADAAQEQQPPILGKGVQQQTRDWGASNVCHDRPLFRADHFRLTQPYRRWSRPSTSTSVTGSALGGLGYD